ncbi:MAG: hypothetical protein ACTSWQ_09120 [Candidatus Thorarchaeota archaeon]
MKTEEQEASDILAKHGLRDIVRKVLDNSTLTETEFTIDIDRYVIVIHDYKGTTGRLIMIQAILAVKISEFYQEQQMPHVHWKLECMDPEQDDPDLEEMGADRNANKEGWNDR